MDEHEMLRVRVETWERAGPELAAIRRREICQADNMKVVSPRCRGEAIIELWTSGRRCASG